MLACAHTPKQASKVEQSSACMRGISLRGKEKERETETSSDNTSLVFLPGVFGLGPL